MAEDTDQCIDCALEHTVNAMNESKHVKNELKKTIMESVSTLRNIFHALKKDILDIITKKEPRKEWSKYVGILAI
jgi:uncharacterized pyridoxamine 5'-phosphate oxidase family protein